MRSAARKVGEKEDRCRANSTPIYQPENFGEVPRSGFQKFRSVGKTGLWPDTALCSNFRNRMDQIAYPRVQGAAYFSLFLSGLHKNSQIVFCNLLTHKAFVFRIRIGRWRSYSKSA